MQNNNISNCAPICPKIPKPEIKRSDLSINILIKFIHKLCSPHQFYRSLLLQYIRGDTSIKKTLLQRITTEKSWGIKSNIWAIKLSSGLVSLYDTHYCGTTYLCRWGFTIERAEICLTFLLYIFVYIKLLNILILTAGTCFLIKPAQT